MTARFPFLRLLLTGSLLVLLGALPTTTGGAPARAAVPPAARAKVAPELARKVAGGGRADFVVFLSARADLARARGTTGHGARVAAGTEALKGAAQDSQKGPSAVLRRAGIQHQGFWLVNVIVVESGDEKTVRTLAEQPEVREIRQVAPVRLPEPPSGAKAAADTPAAPPAGWNIPATGAPQAWERFGTRGEGVVIASIDTGVQFDHPALAASYRGNAGGGTYSHDYNWFDPTKLCGKPMLTPCDNNGHGTHTMGTAAGGNGPDGQPIGMAPGARWIAAKGCEGGSCSVDSLLRAGEWLAAPTDLRGENPRPDLAPHVVNNSWGMFGNDPFYTEMVQGWRDLGIFPVFAAGNSGPECDTTGSPGDYPTTYSVAAYSPSGEIAKFSSRGHPTRPGKPDITAPGETILSSMPGGKYQVMSGTSMAAPHVAGAVALLWSASPRLIGDFAATSALLGSTAVDVADGTCGGTAARNGVWGEGRMDVLAAMTAAPKGDMGAVSMRLTDVDDGQPVAGALAKVTGQGMERVGATAPDGTLRLVLPTGQYTVVVSAFAHLPASKTFTVTAGQTASVALALPDAPTVELTGPLHDIVGQPVKGAQVRLERTPLPAVTSDATGTYRIGGVPPGTYWLTVSDAGCGLGSRREITVTAGAQPALVMGVRDDAAGHTCHGVPYTPLAAPDPIALTGDDAFVSLPLPFPVAHYGQTYGTAWVSTNGFLSFLAGTKMAANSALPHGGPPNASVIPFWDDLVVDASASVRKGVSGAAPQRRFVIEWRNVLIYGTTQRITFQAVLEEQGGSTLQYVDVPAADRAQGSSATIGIDNADGSIAVPFSYNRPILSAQRAYRFAVPGLLQGEIRDLDTGALLDQALVKVTTPNGTAFEARTDATGRYALRLPYGDHQVAASTPLHAPTVAPVTVTPAESVLAHDFRLDANGVRGVVRTEDGAALPGVSVTLDDVTPPVVTGPSGEYRFVAVPAGQHRVTAVLDGCRVTGQAVLDIEAMETHDFVLSRKRDAFGHLCTRASQSVAPVSGTPLALTGDDEEVAVDLPFALPIYGKSYNRAYVSTNGVLSFNRPHYFWNSAEIPTRNGTNAALYPFWDDLSMDQESSVHTAVTGTAPHRSFTVEWRRMHFQADNTRITFQATVEEGGTVRFSYLDIPEGHEQAAGARATIGMENDAGTDALAYSYRGRAVRSGEVVTITGPGAP